MGISLQLRRASVEEFNSIGHGADDLMEFVLTEDEALFDLPSLTDVDKAWHGIHFLLTGSGSAASWPAGFLFSGTERGADWGMGPARFLSVKEVQEVCQHLNSLPSTIVADRLNLKAMKAQDIYPDMWDEDYDVTLDYLSYYFNELETFLCDAARANEVIVMAFI